MQQAQVDQAEVVDLAADRARRRRGGRPVPGFHPALESAKPTLRTLRPAPRRAEARGNTAAYGAWPDLRAQSA